MTDTKPDPYAFTNSAEMGDVVEVPKTYARHALVDEAGQIVPIGVADPIPLDIWRHVIDPATKEPTGYIKRERMRSLKEVAADLIQRLDVVVCDRCGHEKQQEHGCYRIEKHDGCGGEYEAFIDEYLNGPFDMSFDEKLVPHHFRCIACYPVTGSSEGHYVHVEFHVCVDHPQPGQPNCRVVRLALGKTFRGIDHAAEIARRCAVLLGA